MMIPFNKPYLHGRELVYIAESVVSGKLSGDGRFTDLCHKWFESRYGMKKALLTTSCTDALEMSAILLDIQPGDEVIVPSFTFVSSANAFRLRGARIVFADSYYDNPNVSPEEIEALITPKTRAIVVVHYAGVACDMDRIMEIANRYRIPVVEDAAQAVESFYRGQPLGTIGQFGTFSFHETKNVISGEGGLLAINDEDKIARAEIIREKGTNRSAFFRGEIDKYGWVDIGSSFLPSDMIAAYLFAQLEQVDSIQGRRLQIWSNYDSAFRSTLLARGIGLPCIPDWATNNAHMYYLVMPDLESRSRLIDVLGASHIKAVFHYISLHSSPYFREQHGNRNLPNSDRFTDCLVRLPLYCGMTSEDNERVIDAVLAATAG
jgi:dTDP-4-amino-4,6-dideoxygalactose transaminase